MAIDKTLLDEDETSLDVEGSPNTFPMADSAMLMSVEDSWDTIADEDGGVTIIMGDLEELMPLAELPHDANLAEHINEDDLNKIAIELQEDIEADMSSRSEWMETFVDGLELLGYSYEDRSEPWEHACGAYSSVLSEAAIRFQAETMVEVFPDGGPVKTKIIGEETREKREAADRVKADMNYELMDGMPEYRPEHERMLYGLGLMGSAFKKVYKCPRLGRQTAIYVPADEMVVAYSESHIEQAERVTQVLRKTKLQMRAMQESGFYRDVELGDPEPFHTDVEEKRADDMGFTLNEDDRYTLYECHVTMELDGDTGAAAPYIVTMDTSSGKVLSIYRNWDEMDAERAKEQYFVHYVYVPGFGFYGLGLIHIIGSYARTGTSLLRQLVDSGTLANLPGGLKTRDLRVTGGDEPIAPGEWRDVDVASGPLRDNLMPLPYKEPSQTLLALLERITEEARRLAAVSDLKVSDMSANAPVGTTLAILERTLKPMTAVQARIHHSMKAEFKMLKRIIAGDAPAEYAYKPERGEISAKAADYSMVSIIPVSNPNSSTMAQRVTQYQAALQMAEKAPQIYDLPQLHAQMLEVLGIKNVDKIIPRSAEAKPKDPVSENMDALNGVPLKAFIYQDHASHIAAHVSFMQDPMIAQAVGQNPQGKQIMAAIQAHILSHTAFQYRQQMEEALGAPLNAPEDEMPEDMEVLLSRVVADAGKQLSQAHKQQAAQQQAQQQQQDPMFQLEQAKVQNEQAEVQRKAQKDQMDAQAKQAEQERKNRKDAMDAALRAEEVGISAQEAQQDAQRLRAEKLIDVAMEQKRMDQQTLQQVAQRPLQGEQ